MDVAYTVEHLVHGRFPDTQFSGYFYLAYSGVFSASVKQSKNSGP